MIIIWSGSALDIPEGYHLCDGSNGTPDLRNLFIVCAGSSFPVGSTGGFTQHTHSASGTIDSPYISEGEDIAAGADFDDHLASDAVTVTVPMANHLPPYYSLAYMMKL